MSLPSQEYSSVARPVRADIQASRKSEYSLPELLLLERHASEGIPAKDSRLENDRSPRCLAVLEGQIIG